MSSTEKAIKLLLSLGLAAQLGCARVAIDKASDTQSTIDPISTTNAVESHRDGSATVSIPEVQLGDTIEIQTRVANKADVPLIADDFAVIFSINFVITPIEADDREKLSEDAAASRILGHKDLFVATVPYIDPGQELTLRLGSLELNKVIREFRSKDVTPGAANLRISSLVLRSILLDRNGKEISRDERSINLSAMDP
jgi:hypothetical protein